MKRYLLFTGSYWQSRAGVRSIFGWDSLSAQSDNIQLLIRRAEREKAKCWHIVETKSGRKVIDQKNDPDKQ